MNNSIPMTLLSLAGLAGLVEWRRRQRGARSRGSRTASVSVRIGYGTANVFSTWHTGMGDPLYALLSRRGNSVDWVTLDASPSELGRMDETALNILMSPDSSATEERVAYQWLTSSPGEYASITLKQATPSQRSLRGSRGRRYTPDEWVDFFADGHATEQTIAMGQRFSEAVSQVYEEWSEDYPQLQDLDVEEDELAYKTYGSLRGHGIGLWDGGIMPEVQGRAFKAHLCAHHPEICRLGEDLETEIFLDEERGKNPPPHRRSLRGLRPIPE